MCFHSHLLRRPFKDHNFQFPTVRGPLRIRLLHVTSPYSRKIAGSLGRAKQCNCKQPIQELIYALLSSVFDESIMWLRRLELFTDILRYISTVHSLPKRAGVANLLLEKDNKLDLLQLSGFAPAIRLNHNHWHCQDSAAELLKMKHSHNFWWF